MYKKLLNIKWLAIFILISGVSPPAVAADTPEIASQTSGLSTATDEYDVTAATLITK